MEKRIALYKQKVKKWQRCIFSYTY